MVATRRATRTKSLRSGLLVLRTSSKQLNTQRRVPRSNVKRKY